MKKKKTEHEQGRTKEDKLSRLRLPEGLLIVLEQGGDGADDECHGIHSKRAGQQTGQQAVLKSKNVRQTSTGNSCGHPALTYPY